MISGADNLTACNQLYGNFRVCLPYKLRLATLGNIYGCIQSSFQKNHQNLGSKRMVSKILN